MELAIPLIALGGMYVITNQSKTNSNSNSKTNKNNSSSNSNSQNTNSSKKQENFNNMGAKTNYLPNTNVPPVNYPIMNNKELVDTVQEYQNANTATDKYFNQNAYEQRQRAGGKVDSNIQQVYSLSGNYMDSEQFRHNNMVPFNGGKPKGQIYNNNNAETILDNYAGTGSQVIKKIEQAPLFKPQDNIQWAYGAPNMSDFMQSRVAPGLKNNMVKPFESVHVGPGLGKGFSSEGSGGFNSGMEDRNAWLDRTVDEMRVKTNPKLEYSLDTSNRNETTKAVTGTPNSNLKTAGQVPKMYEETKRTQFEGYDVAHSNAAGRGPHTGGEEFLKSHTNYTNNRSVNTQPQTFGSGFSGAIGAVIAPFMDAFRPSKKEEYGCNMRIYGNAGGEVAGTYVQNQGEVTSTTIKETTLYQPNGNIGNQINGAYQVHEQQSIANQRDTTTDCYQLNPAGGAASKHGSRQYDAVYRQTNNDTKEKLVAGRINQGNAKNFNSSINMSMSKLDSDRDNNRLWAPSATTASGPSLQTYGTTNTPQYVNAYQDNNRIDSSLLSAFMENPYTHSLSSVA